MISHEHKTVFIHIPKCGGQSVETCFLDDLGLSNQSAIVTAQERQLQDRPMSAGPYDGT